MNYKEVYNRLQGPAKQSESEEMTDCYATVFKTVAVLQNQDIKDPEELLDLIFDYDALAKQDKQMYQRYEVPDKMKHSKNGEYFCPRCGRHTRPFDRHCSKCGKRIEA